MVIDEEVEEEVDELVVESAVHKLFRIFSAKAREFEEHSDNEH